MGLRGRCSHTCDADGTLGFEGASFNDPSRQVLAAGPMCGVAMGLSSCIISAADKFGRRRTVNQAPNHKKK